MKLSEFDFESNLNIPLWAVYGHEAWPQMLCFAVKGYPDGTIAAWGYSIYKRSPGFRTLGTDPRKWFAEHNANIFTDQEEALAFLKTWITPKPKALQQLEGWK